MVLQGHSGQVTIPFSGTPAGSKENPDRKRKYESNTLAGHIGLPSDIASAVPFLISEKARYIYAAILPVNGRGTSSR